MNKEQRENHLCNQSSYYRKCLIIKARALTIDQKVVVLLDQAVSPCFVSSYFEHFK